MNYRFFRIDSDSNKSWGGEKKREEKYAIFFFLISTGNIYEL